MGRVLLRLLQLVSYCLDMLHSRFLRWTKPLSTSLPLGTLTDLSRSKPELMAENALLRKPLIMLKRQVKRPACTKADRLLLVLLARMVRTWKQAHITRATRNTSALASPGLPPLLEAEVKGNANTREGEGLDHCIDQRDGKQQSTSSGLNGFGASC